MNGKSHAGIDRDPKGAMNPPGNIIRDARVFGLIPETGTCAGWTVGQREALYAQDSEARGLGRNPEVDFNDG